MNNFVRKIDEMLMSKKVSPIVFWFLLKVIVLYLVLDNFFTLYTGLTIPGGLYSSFLDNHLDFISSFRSFLLWGGVQFASLIGYPADYIGLILYVRGGASVQLVYSCLGFGLMSAYMALVLAWPARWVYRAVSLLVGVAIIIILNMIRLGGLAVLYTTGNYGFFKYINHHDLFNIVVLLVVLILFILYVNYSHREEAKKAEKGNS